MAQQFVIEQVQDDGTFVYRGWKIEMDVQTVYCPTRGYITDVTWQGWYIVEDGCIHTQEVSNMREVFTQVDQMIANSATA